MLHRVFQVSGLLAALVYFIPAGLLLSLGLWSRRQTGTIRRESIMHLAGTLGYSLSVLLALPGIGHVIDASLLLFGSYPPLWVGTTNNVVETIAAVYSSVQFIRTTPKLLAGIRALRRMAGEKGYDI